MRVPILTYHAILPLPAGTSLRGTVPLSAFRAQMAWLARRRYSTLSLDQLAAILAGHAEVPRRPVLLTFDDGYRCVVEHALAVLAEFGLAATMFVVTDRVGGSSDWYADKGGVAFDHAGWDQLERARAAGIAVESHSCSHRRLAQLSRGQLEDELGTSRAVLAERLGSCDHFAYPFGECSAAALAAVRSAGYHTAVTTRSGCNRPAAEPHQLRRQNVGRKTRPWQFRRRAGAWW